MPRYTDIDKLIAEYDRVHIGPAGGARKLMVEAPIADVAPRKDNDVPRYIKLPQPEYLLPTAEELEALAAKLYQSPIEIIMQEMQTQFEGEVFKATQAYGINVDKDKLIKALQYDRDQYNKGFADGSRLNTDVIRAEVAREIFQEIYADLFRMLPLKVCHLMSGDIVGDRFDAGKERALHDVIHCVAELEKEYTEGTNDV